MKRKGFEVSDVLYDAKRSRTMEAMFPSIVEEEEPSIPLVYEQQLIPEQIIDGFQNLEVLNDETLPALTANEEKAVVLYKPVEEPLVLPSSSSHFSFTVSQDLIAGIKCLSFWPGNPSPAVVTGVQMDNKSASDNTCRAIIPWVPSHAPDFVLPPEDFGSVNRPLEEPMDTEEVEGTSMEVEKEREQGALVGLSFDSFEQWQQYCMTPDLQQTTSSSTMKSW